MFKISLDNPIPTTPGGGDTVNEEFDDFIHIEEQGPKEGVVIAQPAPSGPVASSAPLAEDPSTQAVKNPSALDAPST